MKVKPIVHGDEPYGYGFLCPGCGSYHDINTVKKRSNGAIWNFSGDLNKPTFTPSINWRTGKYADPDFVDEEGLSEICHFVITDGVIGFCGDCTHQFAGRTMELPDIV